MYYSADKAIVITSSRFTRPAIKLASANNVTLIDGDMLYHLPIKETCESRKNERESR